MNRLILIGNGFDLAHGLQTSYCHFISDYLANAINDFQGKSPYDDPLIGMVKLIFSEKVPELEPINADNGLQVFKEYQKDKNYVITIKSKLFSKTLEKVDNLNWVDLENEYFDQLLSHRTRDSFDYRSVANLNLEFEFLKQKLNEYLSRHEKEFYTYSIFRDQFCENFCENFKKNDFVNLEVKVQKPNNLYILSFNYTATTLKYANKCAKMIKTQHNQIHGELNSKDNPVIFGFGDEYDKAYINFEDHKNKELLRHIKSFSYFKTTKYHDLLRFIEADDFQVYIFGHSCGLSDRTMLKHIFENDKCKSIKIFYHDQGDEQNDFTDKTYDLAKHFSDKGLLRKKLVSFQNSLAMPQVFRRHPSLWDPGEF